MKHRGYGETAVHISCWVSPILGCSSFLEQSIVGESEFVVETPNQRKWDRYRWVIYIGLI